MGGFSGLPDRPAELIEYIRDAYHRLELSDVSAAGTMLSATLAEHGDDCQDLYSLGRLLEQLRDLIASHVSMEEEPFAAAATAQFSPSSAVLSSIEELLAKNEADFARVFQNMRLLTLDYTGLGRRCPQIASLMSTLREVEANCKRHLYVEREILVPLLRDGDLP